jgi:Flp pilus assembly protein TadB
MVTVINSVVGGSAVAIAVGAITDAPLGVSAAIGVVVAIASIVGLRRHEQRMLTACYQQLEVLFPSPQAP